MSFTWAGSETLRIIIEQITKDLMLAVCTSMGLAFTPEKQEYIEKCYAYRAAARAELIRREK